MKINDYYTQELRDYAEEWLEFDFEKGEIYWKKSQGNRKSGGRAGCVQKLNAGKEYRRIMINGKCYLEHRLLYCFFHKDSFEGLQIDHIDQNSLNNAIDNLRYVTRSENLRNKKKQSNNTSGATGVTFYKGRWRVRIGVDGERMHLGYFDTQKEAEARRQEAEIEHNYHENHGK